MSSCGPGVADGSSLASVPEAVGEDVANVLVRQAVVHHPPALGAGDDVAITQQAQLMAQR